MERTKPVFHELNTKRLTLRMLRDSDLDELFSIRSSDVVNLFLDRKKDIQREDTAGFIRKIKDGVERGDTFYWAVCPDGDEKLAGTICLWNFSPDRTVADIGYELAPKFQGRGIMSEAAEKIIAFGFTALRLIRIEACTHKDNTKSIRLLEKLSFRMDPEATNSVTKADNASQEVVYAIEINLQ